MAACDEVRAVALHLEALDIGDPEVRFEVDAVVARLHGLAATADPPATCTRIGCPFNPQPKGVPPSCEIPASTPESPRSSLPSRQAS